LRLSAQIQVLSFKLKVKMATLKIKEIDLTTYLVTIVDSIATQHEVTVEISYALSLTASKISTEQLIKNAFGFLLARESNRSILRNFELSKIGFYFPEFEEEMRKLLP
jgi:hypothetical protein